MKRLLALGVVLAALSFCHTTAHKIGTVVVDDRRIGVGIITDGHFGSESFSIDTPASGRPPVVPTAYVNEDNADNRQVIIQKPTNHKETEDNNRPPQHDGGDPNSEGDNSDNASLNPVNPLAAPVNSGQENIAANEDSQLLVGTVILTNKENKRKNGNKQPEPNASDIKPVLASNDGNDSFPITNSGFSSSDGNIQIGAITGSNFPQGALKLNKRPEANVPQNSVVNNENTKYPNADNEAQHSIGHSSNNNGADHVGGGNNHVKHPGYISGSNEDRWIWD